MYAWRKPSLSIDRCCDLPSAPRITMSYPRRKGSALSCLTRRRCCLSPLRWNDIYRAKGGNAGLLSETPEPAHAVNPVVIKAPRGVQAQLKQRLQQRVKTSKFHIEGSVVHREPPSQNDLLTCCRPPVHRPKQFPPSIATPAVIGSWGPRE